MDLKIQNPHFLKKKERIFLTNFNPRRYYDLQNSIYPSFLSKNLADTLLFSLGIAH